MSRTEARHRVNREMDRTAFMKLERPMPLYACHKRVRALRIANLDIHADGSATITPKEDGFAPFATRPGWGERYGGTLRDPGVFVQYEDGFTSWSPTVAFEAGYAPMEGAHVG